MCVCVHVWMCGCVCVCVCACMFGCVDVNACAITGPRCVCLNVNVYLREYMYVCLI